MASAIPSAGESGGFDPGRNPKIAVSLLQMRQTRRVVKIAFGENSERFVRCGAFLKRCHCSRTASGELAGSTRKSTRSASRAELGSARSHALDGVVGRRRPAVSSRRKVTVACAPRRVMRSRTTSRVVPGISETIERSSPKRALKKLDFPALGRPTNATLTPS